MALNSQDRQLARRLVDGAGAGALRLRTAPEDLETRAKTNPTDLVTEADLAAERFVVELLTLERADDAILGEEGAVRPGTSGRTWVVDPVDGTYNFVRGSRRWCSAVALVDESGPLVGAVSRPAYGETTVGGPGIGVEADGRPLPLLRDRELAESALATYLHPPFHTGPVGAAWRRVVSGVATIRMSGSGSLDAVDVAHGRADLVVHHTVPDWDRLPGEAIIRGVGGDARLVEAAGVTWYVAGVPTAVARACDLLVDR